MNSFHLCRTCTCSWPSPTAWYTWTCLGRTAQWTWFVFIPSLFCAHHRLILSLGWDSSQETAKCSTLNLNHTAAKDGVTLTDSVVLSASVS